MFLNPRMTAAAYGRFYDGVYRPLVSAFHGRLIDARTIQAEQRDYAADRAEFVRPFVDALRADDDARHRRIDRRRRQRTSRRSSGSPGR